MSSDAPAEQPQPPPAAEVSQHEAFSEGSQQVACASVEQQEEGDGDDGSVLS
jgi:hypothetical protein